MKAEAALEALCEQGSGAPPNVVASAARTILELTGAIGRRNREPDQDDRMLDLEPEGLSLDAIEEEIRRTGEV